MNINTDKIIESLQNGGVVLLPSDTVYGLAASPLHENAVNRIYELKSRPRNRKLPIMTASVNEIENIGLDINSYAKKLLSSHFVPGALTLILGFKTVPLLSWLSGREEVAVRIPKNTRLLNILKKTGALLVTSANKHGQSQTPSTVPEILSELNGLPDIIIDKGHIENLASTIINCRSVPPRIEREGCISSIELFKILNNE